MSALILKERMEAREYVGCVIVLLAVIIAEVDVPRLFKNAVIKKRNADR
jgi:drug/metabolite transporter (DMT)-like permease